MTIETGVSALPRAAAATRVSVGLTSEAARTLRRSQLLRAERAARLATPEPATARVGHRDGTTGARAAADALSDARADGAQSALVVRAVFGVYRPDAFAVQEATRAAWVPIVDAQHLPPTVRRAVEFIEANAHESITAADIAAAAFVTVRAVQVAFQRHLSTTPLLLLRDKRLAHAREEFVAAASSRSVTVSEVAARWHFSNATRFSQYYRQKYGETPRETLLRPPPTGGVIGVRTLLTGVSPGRTS